MSLLQLVNETADYTSSEVVVGSSIIYRGLSRPLRGSRPFQLPIRQDRRPRDSSALQTAIFNKLFEVAHGIADIRNKSLFCSTSRWDASEYAVDIDALAIVVPVRGTQVAFNPNIEDSIQVLSYIETIVNSIEGTTTSTNETVADIGHLPAYEAVELFHELVEQHADDLGSTVRKVAEAIRNYQVGDIESVNLRHQCELMLFGVPFAWGIASHTLEAYGDETESPEAMLDKIRQMFTPGGN